MNMRREEGDDLHLPGWSVDQAAAAVALSIYAYNVSPMERAKKIHDHFRGDCAELEDLVEVLAERGAYAMTELAMPSAVVYLQHALERYGEEARERVLVNLGLERWQPKTYESEGGGVD